MSALKIVFVDVGGESETSNETAETMTRFVRELAEHVGAAVDSVRSLTPETVTGHDFVLVNTSHPEVLLESLAPEYRGELARRLVAIGISRSSNRTLQLMEQLSLPAVVKGNSFEHWDERADALQMGAYGLYGLRDIGALIGAECMLHTSGTYGYIDRTPRGITKLLGDYLVELHRQRSSGDHAHQ